MRNRLRLVCLSACLVSAACQHATPPDSALDDEAMQRYKAEQRAHPGGPGMTPDEAARAWFYPKRVDNYFAGMDGIVTSPSTVYQLLQDAPPPATIADPVSSYNEIFGRNAWMIWCGGNEGFWDWLNTQFGFIDLLKLVDSRNRSTRFADAGLINEPGMVAADGPVDDEFGLFLDQPADPAVRQWRRDYIRAVMGDMAGTGSSTPAPGSQGLYTTERTQPRGVKYDPDSAYRLRVPPPEIYGLSSGVVGLRLFPNPRFDAKAKARWDAQKYYGDARSDPEVVRPFRIGMSCAFCHASYHPLKPPLDLKNPSWENISGNIGAQYLRTRATFGNQLPKDNFVYHILDSQPPGTIDTSLIASDNINNPNAMNSVFNLAQRALVAFRNPKEKQAGPSRELPSLWRHPEANPNPNDPDATPASWRDLFAAEGLADGLHDSNGDPRRVPRILFDGADSIGAWGALARVYLNIGTNYEQWITLHNTVVGFQPQKSFTIANTLKHSIYWRATGLRVAALRDYFLKVTPPMPMLAVDGGQARTYQSTPGAPRPSESERYRSIDLSQLKHGREVFAHNCIVCHSSIQPPQRFAELERTAATGQWDHDPGRWLSDPEYRKWAEAAVEAPAFWQKNYLSTDYRVAVNLVQTNACRAMATNAVTGNMWEDFASESYRRLPSVGVIPFFNPYLGEHGGDDRFFPRHQVRDGSAPRGGGGPGYYRVPTLVSVWATAPLLHNNSLGRFTNDPSLDGRLTAFDDAIHKLLYPERRLASSSFNDATPERLRQDHGLIWRTTADSYLTLPSEYLPRVLGAQSAAIAMLRQRLPFLMGIPTKYRAAPSAVLLAVAFVVLLLATRGLLRLIGYAAIGLALIVGFLVYFLNGALLDVRIGPIPKGTPVNLLANVNPDTPPEDLRKLINVAADTFRQIESMQPIEADRQKILHDRLAPALLAVSKCPDMVMDHGHYYEWFKAMSTDDKEALIELLKTF
jgi:hypothetical protein